MMRVRVIYMNGYVIDMVVPGDILMHDFHQIVNQFGRVRQIEFP